MASKLEVVSYNKTHSGQITKFKFKSSSLGDLVTSINVFVPLSTETDKKFPVLFYLAGLTCNEDTGPQKGGFLKEAAKQEIALVFPDTSPRGANVEGEGDDWDFGTGAGFYLNATHPKWAKHYQMEKLITEEIPNVLEASDLPLDLTRKSIFGHSMGGHGALTLYLNHPTLYKSCSAFAPISNPTNCAWGKKAFTGPNGNDGYLAKGLEEGRKYDATELIKHAKASQVKILVDYGSSDQFYKDGQLLPENFVDASSQRKDLKDSEIEVRKQDEYDHSYYFINTFATDHLEFHAKYLKNL
ncbi:family 1 carbohydrate esterase [Melampsora americana]|nr:family 1 carbohydrate esterase [Melampsora americana]